VAHDRRPQIARSFGQRRPVWVTWASTRSLSRKLSPSLALVIVRVTRSASASDTGFRGRRTPFSYTASTCWIMTIPFYAKAATFGTTRSVVAHSAPVGGPPGRFLLEE
jgi:hypothetical protein